MDEILDYMVNGKWKTDIKQTRKLEVNKIAARWPAKAVAQFSTFSKKGSDRIIPR